MTPTKPRLLSPLVSPQMRETAIDLLMKAADWAAERLPAPKASRPIDRAPMRLVAHRGAWRERGCIENTFSAFDKAREAGVWGLEFDVRFTKDDIPVVHHDDSLLRTFGRSIEISSTTFNTLRHEAKEIPTLTEVIAEYGSSFHLFIEIKGEREDLTEIRLERLLEPLREHALQPAQQFHFMAFDFDILKTLNQLKGIPKSALVSVVEWNVQAASDRTLEEGYAGFTCHWLAMTDALLQRHHSSHQFCGVGFLNSKASLMREWARGVDWGFTNEAVKASQWLDEIAKR